MLRVVLALATTALAILLAATAVVVLRSGALPRWLGWSATVLSPALLVGVALATSFGFVPYVLSMVWIVATSIVLIRRAGGSPRPKKTRPS